ncbi:hypothetical protein [uncultured Endozoicomonas sp.]|uniref:hypothetical protein n=1 Tax=uncultured Endozoicomonas sp. TaxID=432652 RepID=UPI00262169E3|nr:hypothetical protein [uncultured Endozoicomonas sp.]
MTPQTAPPPANNAINPAAQNPAKNDKQNVGWLRWGISLVTNPIWYLAKHIWIAIKAIASFVVYIVKAPFCYLSAALSNKPDDPKTLPAQAQPKQVVNHPQRITPSQKELNINPLPPVTPIVLDFKKDDNKTQAEKILQQAQTLLQNNPDLSGVAVTYSANHEQTLKIIDTYNKGNWFTGTNGANQADVMREMEKLLETGQFKHLQSKMRIAPITTMQHDGSSATNDEFAISLDNIKQLTNNNWHILGWQNQLTHRNTVAPFAIGGGVSKAMPADHQRQIQDHLKQLANM